MADRLCWSCQHIRWTLAEGGYSEYTPGTELHILCVKTHWFLNNYEDGLPTFRRYLEMARTCNDFVLSAEATQIEAARQS